MELPGSLERLIGELAKLPGVGRRGAERMAMGMVAGKPGRLTSLREALEGVEQQLGICEVCGYFTEACVCPICTSTTRDDRLMMVVERAVDVMALEKAGGFRGRYHVLGGHLSPLKGIGPSALHLEGLLLRVARPVVEELILATGASVEGDATALYIAREVRRPGLAITRLGRGVPMGSNLEFTDSGTLRLAVEGRRNLDP